MLLIGSPKCCIIMIKSQNVVERQVGRPGGTGCDHDDDAG